MLSRVVAIFLTVACMSACMRRADAPVPRPTAYPRISDPGSEYSAVDSLPLIIEANTHAVVSRPRDGWLDIAYPGLDATVHISLTPVAARELDGVIDNRRQRMSLNVGDRPYNNIVAESPGFSAIMVDSPDTRSTPLQFLAHNGRSWVVSGTVFFAKARPDSPIDSLAPAVDYIRRDIIHLLSALAAK